MPNSESVPVETDNPVGQVMEASDPVPARPAEAGFDITRERTTQAIRSAAMELDHLKKLLAAQDAAKLHAQSVAAGLQRELKSFETDNNRLRGELKKAHDQQAVAKHDHNTELYQAGERESALKRELLETRAQLAGIIEKTSGRGKKWFVMALAVGIAAMILAIATEWRSHVQAGGGDAAAADPVVADSGKPAAPAAAGTRDFAGAMSRLDQALNSFKSEKPNDVLQRVHLANKVKGIDVCSFEWNNGQISMLFGSKEGMDIDKAMARCADAVEKAAK
jgi:hypothetical protein